MTTVSASREALVELVSTTGIQPLPPIMTAAEVAAVLRCEEDVVVRYVHRHKLVAILIGRERRFRADDVLDFITAQPATVDMGK